MREYDDAVLECFLDKQLQLFPEAVAETLDEAEDFLEECMAVVVDSVEDVIEYFDEAGMDVDGAVDDEILEAEVASNGAAAKDALLAAIMTGLEKGDKNSDGGEH